MKNKGFTPYNNCDKPDSNSRRQDERFRIIANSKRCLLDSESAGNCNRSCITGFTIVELLVAMSVFSILLAIVVGVFVQGLRSQRILVHLMAINDNAGLVLEQMAREIRSSYDFCPANRPCDPINFSDLNFTNYQGELVRYFFNTETKSVERNGFVLTAPDVEVRNLKFKISQSDNDLDPANDICNPWRIVVSMEVGSTNEKISQVSRLQTTVSSRVLPREMPGASEAIIEQCVVRG